MSRDAEKFQLLEKDSEVWFYKMRPAVQLIGIIDFCNKMAYGFNGYKIQDILLRTQNFYKTIAHTQK